MNTYYKHPNLYSNFQQAHADRHKRRTAIRKLQALNDHYLKDIGLDRSEIVSSIEEIIKMDTPLS